MKNSENHNALGMIIIPTLIDSVLTLRITQDLHFLWTQR